MHKFTHSQILLIILFNISYAELSRINSPAQPYKQVRLSAAVESPVTAAKAVTEKSSNIYFSDVNAFGTFGGVCTCPDGSKYNVSDRRNSCGDLACIGGVAGRCFGNTENNWRHMGVVCDGKKPKPTPLATSDAKATTSTKAAPAAAAKKFMRLAQEATTSTTADTSNLLNITSNVTISWDKRTLCQFDTTLATDNKVHCRTMLSCMNSAESLDTFSCIDWDAKAKVLNKFQITGCNQELGINTCSTGLVSAGCEKKHGVFDNQDFLTNRLYACSLDTSSDYVIEYADCKFDNFFKIARCCESNTGNDTVCRHFKLEGDANKDVVADMILANPDFRLNSLGDTINFASQ